MKETDKLSAASSDIKKGLGDASQAARAKQGELKEVDEGRVKLQQEIQGLEVKHEEKALLQLRCTELQSKQIKYQQHNERLKADLEEMTRRQESCTDLEKVELQYKQIVAEKTVLQVKASIEANEREGLEEALKKTFQPPKKCMGFGGVCAVNHSTRGSKVVFYQAGFCKLLPWHI